MSWLDSLRNNHRRIGTRKSRSAPHMANQKTLSLETLEARTLMTTYSVVGLDTAGGRRDYSYALNDTPTAPGFMPGTATAQNFDMQSDSGHIVRSAPVALGRVQLQMAFGQETTNSLTGGARMPATPRIRILALTQASNIAAEMRYMFSWPSAIKLA